MRFGYARVSSTSQSVEVQCQALNVHVCERIITETKSGATLEGRPELQALLRILRRGDEIFVTRLDRLARSVQDLLNIVGQIEKAEATLHVIEQPIETRTSAGRMFLTILGAFAAFENEIRKERQLEGIAHAKAIGKYKGNTRGPSYDREVIWELFHYKNMPIAKIAKKLGCAGFTVRRAIKEIQEKQRREAEAQRATEARFAP